MKKVFASIGNFFNKVFTAIKKFLNKKPIYVVKRMNMSKKMTWIIKVIGIFVAFLLSGVICNLFRPGTFGTYFTEMFSGCFDFSDPTIIIDLLVCIAFYVLVALALTPCFRMKYWNIGAEGQVLVSCLVCAVISFIANRDKWNINPTLFLLLLLVACVTASVIWTVIPALFKAFFNTNETLFTLMMNYIASVLVGLCISLLIKNGSGTFGVLRNGKIPDLFDMEYLWVIIVVAVVAVAMIFYLGKSKHGYEINVIGESVNTARYVGINVKKVIIRTSILTGVLCGLMGFLLVAGVEHTLNANLVGGRGFTGVLIAWLGHFNPYEIFLYAALVGIFKQGTTKAATKINMSSTHFSAIVTGMFFLIIIACEFFVNYQIKIHKKEKEILEFREDNNAPVIDKKEDK